MCDPRAINAVMNPLSGVHSFIEQDPTRPGQPLQKQIRLSKDYITSTGGTVTVLPSTDEVILNGVLTADLIIDLSSDARLFYNQVNRRSVITSLQTRAAHNVQIVLPAGFHFIYDGAALPLVKSTLQFPTAATASSIELYWSTDGVIVIGDITGFTFP